MWLTYQPHHTSEQPHTNEEAYEATEGTSGIKFRFVFDVMTLG